jgi:nucleoside 2-deoxyribosyltransferase
MKPIVYLAGPVTGLSFNQAYEWRKTASDLLAPRIECANPVRGQLHLKDEAAIKHTYIGNPFTSQRGIMVQDHYDVCRSTVLLVNLLGAREKSQGTGMELAWAWDKHIPVVAVIEDEGNPHDGHPMILETFSFRCSDLLTGIEIIRRLVIPE